MGEFCALRAKTYAYIMADGSEKKKAMFGNYTDCLFTDKIILKSQQRFKSYNHDAYTEEVNKIALSSNDDKRLQTFDRITTYPYGTNAFKVCESEMMKSYYNHNKDLKVYIEQVCNDMIKYKWSILMIMRMKIKLSIIRILIIGGSRSGNALLTLIEN